MLRTMRSSDANDAKRARPSGDKYGQVSTDSVTGAVTSSESLCLQFILRQSPGHWSS
jgi:hypothetical protein